MPFRKTFTQRSGARPRRLHRHGTPTLSAQLPGGGWPVGTLVDLNTQQPGIGEVRLLDPALKAVATRRVVFLQPPHAPQAIALAALGLQPSQLLWLRSERTGANYV